MSGRVGGDNVGLPGGRPANPWRPAIRRWGLGLIGRLYPRPQAISTSLRSVLLIRPDHLGDVLFLTPALHALRRRLPQARLTLLVGPWSQAVMAGNPDLDEVLTCPFPAFERQPKRSWTAPYALLRDTARQLRSRGYDAALVLRFDHWWGAWLVAAAGIPRRIGYDRPEVRPFLTQSLTYEAHRHEVEQNGRLLAYLAPGLEQDLGPLRFTVSQADRDWATDWLAGHGLQADQPLVAIHPGAGATVKQWPVSAWVQVAVRLAEDGARIMLTGSAAERPLTQAVAAGLPQGALDAAGETSLGRLAALYERAAVVLGPDCGPLHLAVAVGTPTVHLYGPADPAKFGPWGDPARHIVLKTNWTCAPCNRLDWPAEVLPQHACMASISPEDVVRAALPLAFRRFADSLIR